MYMHNKGDAQRRQMTKAYYEWKETHGEPAVIGSDTNSIDDIAEDVAIWKRETQFRIQDWKRQKYSWILGHKKSENGNCNVSYMTHKEQVAEWKVTRATSPG